jgi:hypothetical protein
MKSIKNIIAAFLLVGTLSVSTFADGIIIGSRDGIMVSDAVENGDPCTAVDDGIIIGSVVSAVTGIIIGSRTGLLISDRTGLLISDRADSSNETCGIIIGS